MSFSSLKLNRSSISDRLQSMGGSSLVFGVLILAALGFFEIFNFSTTHFALRDLLGDLKFMGIQWSTTLAIAFCAIDFAGISRMFTPEEGKEEPKEVWYLFGAWLLAATMNAALTWWGVSMAIANHSVQSTSIVEAGTILKVVPIFIAILVWVIRVLVIGSISAMGSRLLWGSQPARRSQYNSRPAVNRTPVENPIISSTAPRPTRSSTLPRAAAPRTATSSRAYPRPEPTYHAMGGSESESTTTTQARNF